MYAYRFLGVDSTGLPAFEDANKSGAVNTGFAATGRGDHGVLYGYHYAEVLWRHQQYGTL